MEGNLFSALVHIFIASAHYPLSLCSIQVTANELQGEVIKSGQMEMDVECELYILIFIN